MAIEQAHRNSDIGVALSNPYRISLWRGEHGRTLNLPPGGGIRPLMSQPQCARPKEPDARPDRLQGKGALNIGQNADPWSALHSPEAIPPT